MLDRSLLRLLLVQGYGLQTGRLHRLWHDFGVRNGRRERRPDMQRMEHLYFSRRRGQHPQGHFLGLQQRHHDHGRAEMRDGDHGEHLQMG